MVDRLRVTLCVDALERQLGGIGRYTWELAQRVPAHEDIDSVSYFARGRLIDDPLLLLTGEALSRSRGVLRAARAWQARRALRSTVVHAPNYFLPRAAETGIATIHDLSVFHYPETHPKARVEQFERLFGSSLKRAVHFITDTETTRRELIGAFHVPSERVTAIPLGVSSQFRPLDEAATSPSLRNWGLEHGAYGLCVSALEPRKKVLELLAAWRRLPQKLRGRFPLVLAGGSGWRNEHIHEQLAVAAAEGWLRNLGHVDEAELPRLYAGAALFIYPSAYEGFGLPPVEAMASGVPVIVSNRSCLPEVCGEAVGYVDPDDDNEFLSGITEALVNGQWRSEAVRRGLARAAHYTWARCIEDTVAVYRGVNLN
jgi:glycosyltransferase involved in cell wall biosynthesis